MRKLLILSLAVLIRIDLYTQDTIRILHYTETTGFNHNTKLASERLFLRICDSLTANTNSVWVLTSTDSSEIFDNLVILQNFQVVVWANTSGSSGLTTSQQQNYEQYVHSGGNYLGIHAASDTYRHSNANGSNTGVWDFYAEMLSGCSVQEGPHHTAPNHNNVMTHQISHPILDAIPDPWNKTEEYYYWENGFISSEFTTLLKVNATGVNSYDAARMTAHIREHSWGSRSFYTSLGHSANDFDNNLIFETLLKNALLWTAHQNLTSYTIEVNNSNLTIHPNPFSSSIHLSIPPSPNSSLTIYDFHGRPLYTQLQFTGVAIDLSFLSNGIYLIVLKSNDKIFSKTIVKY